jgi:hypothetical protein
MWHGRPVGRPCLQAPAATAPSQRSCWDFSSAGPLVADFGKTSLLVSVGANR